MKNYFEMLGLEPSENLTDNEVKKAYTDTIISLSTNSDIDVIMNASKAYDTLKTKELRNEYIANKNIASSEEVVEDLEDLETKKETKPKKIIKWNTLLTTAALVMAMVSLIPAIKKDGNSFEKDLNTKEEPSTISDTIIEKEPKKEAEQEEAVETIDASNFEEKVVENENYLSTQGLDTDIENVESVFFITNIDKFDEDFSKELFANKNFDIVDIIERMYNYVSDVRTHNNNGGKYISMADIAYDKEDRAIIEAIDNEYMNLVNILSNNGTKEEYQASFAKVVSFYEGNGKLSANDKNYTINTLTCGGGLLAEAYWPLFAVAYSSSEYMTKENNLNIRSLSEGVSGSPAIVNGSRFLSAIINSDNATCLENSKTK